MEEEWGGYGRKNMKGKRNWKVVVWYENRRQQNETGGRKRGGMMGGDAKMWVEEEI